MNKHKQATREIARRLDDRLLNEIVSKGRSRAKTVTECCVIAIYRAELARRAYQERQAS